MIHLPLRVLQEFRASAIPDRLTLANIGWMEGDEAIVLLTEKAIGELPGHAQQYATGAVRKLRERYDFARHGGWYAIAADTPYFKPRKPRKDYSKPKGFGSAPKDIKYETGAKCEASPIFPIVDPVSASDIFDRYGATPLVGESFWDAVKRCNLPILITEGLKKALAAIAHGIPSIAIRGITQWNIKGTGDLKPELAQFATEGRILYTAFDQDEKVKTRIAVYRQVCKLSIAFESHNAIARVMTWDGREGKGLDDALFTAKDGAQQWLQDRLKASLSLKDYRATAAREAAIMRLNTSKASKFPLARFTEGDRYFPALPVLPRGCVTVLDGNTGSGKTQTIAQMVSDYRALGILVLVLSPLNSLGKQTAIRLGIPHIHDYGASKEDRDLLWAEVQAYGGLVCCPDSLPRIAGWFTDRPVALIFDEANQVIDHTTGAQTIGDNLPMVASQLKAIAQNAATNGAIVLSEDGVPDRAIDFIRSISGCDRVERYYHRRDSAPYRITAFNTPGDYRAALFDRLDDARDRPLLLVTASKAEGKILEQIIHEYFPELKAIRVDGDTNEQGRFDKLFTNPDQWLQDERPNVLILSPSAKSGVSIEGGVSAEDAYFRDVWGYFTCHDTDTHLQQLGRYRPPVPRFIFVPHFLITSHEESLGFKSAEVAKILREYSDGMAQILEVEALEDGDRDLELETAILNYRAETAVAIAAQKSIARESLKARLTDVGHTWQATKHPSKAARQAARKLWSKSKEKVWRAESEQGASLDIEDRQQFTVKWAIATLSSTEASHESRLKARKVLLRESFPGIDFNSAEDWYEVILKDGGKLRSAIQLQVNAENPEYAKALDAKDASKILGASIRAFHRMPRRYAKGALISYLGLPEFAAYATDNPYDNADPRVKAIKAKALQYATEIYRMLRIQIKPEQTPVEVANKLLRKIGRIAKAIKQNHNRATGDRGRVFAVNSLSKIHERFLEASRRKASSTGHLICIKDSPPHNKSSDHPNIPSDGAIDWYSPEGQAILAHDLRRGIPIFWAPQDAIDRAIASEAMEGIAV